MAAESKNRSEKAMGTALFRYALIRQVDDPELTKKQRGALVRHLASQMHQGPDGQLVTVSRESIDRWARLWRQGGFDALLPAERNIGPRTDPALLEFAFALKKERPERTAAQVAAIVKAKNGDGPSERTLQTHFARAGLNRPTKPVGIHGRFEAEAANQRWTGDAMHGPQVGGRKALLFAYEDDHSRLLVGYRWVRREDTVRAEAALRPAIEARGIPDSIYLDNGAPFIDQQLRQTLARLKVRLIHSKPRQPEGRGKIERFFRTVRDQFLVEIDDNQISTIEELNRLFTAWVETVYHRRTHSETGQTPLERWEESWGQRKAAGLPGPRFAEPGELAQAFLWSVERKVTKIATISLEGNTYEVPAHLTHRHVEVRFDPFNLDDLDVYLGGKFQGKAKPQEIRQHVHPKARPDETSITAVTTGISYLELIQEQHEKQLAKPISFATGLGDATDADEPTLLDHIEEQAA